MKKVIAILALGITLVSCNETPTKVDNPKKETTIELQQLANADTTKYKVIEKDDVMYVLSSKDNVVVKKIKNDSGVADTLFLFVFGFLIIALIIVLTAGNI
jgi:hypothetical protein